MVDLRFKVSVRLDAAKAGLVAPIDYKVIAALVRGCASPEGGPDSIEGADDLDLLPGKFMTLQFATFTERKNFLTNVTRYLSASVNAGLTITFNPP